jgi:biopolymer transport protein ExbD
MNTVIYSNFLGQCSSDGKEVSYRDVWLAIAGTALLHTLIATFWQPSEVELVTPPPEVKPVEPIKPKPIVKKKTVQQAKPKPATPKVLQKTVTEALPEVKAIKPVYAPVPVFAKPVNKALLKADPEVTVQFQADKLVPYGKVADAMAVVHKAGIGKLAFIIRE